MELEFQLNVHTAIGEFIEKKEHELNERFRLVAEDIWDRGLVEKGDRQSWVLAFTTQKWLDLSILN